MTFNIQWCSLHKRENMRLVCFLFKGCLSDYKNHVKL